MASPLPRRPLGNTGLEVSILGFGAAPLGGVFQPIDDDTAAQVVKAAFDRGMNFFDTSPYYGTTRSETVLGKAIASLPRDEIIVATKVGRYGVDTFDFSAERVTASVHESLERLKLDYIDIIHCHDIEFGSLDQIVEETIPALLTLKDQGLVKYIGITGLPLKIYSYVLDRVKPGSIDVILSYCHHSLADDSLNSVIPYLQEKKVGIINASALCMGLLTPQGPPDWHPAPSELQEAAKEAAAVASEKGVSLPKLGMMETVKNATIATTLVGLCDINQVHENCDAALQALGLMERQDAAKEDAALHAVNEILREVKGMTWSSGRPENN